MKQFKLVRRIAMSCAAAAGIFLSGGTCFAEDTGAVAGQFILDGEVPEIPLGVKKGDATVKDAAVCAAVDQPNETLVVNPKSKGIANIFVYLVKAPKGMPAELKKSKDAEVIFDQKNCHFIPHCLLARVDQTVMVKSSDPISHNTHTYPVAGDGKNTTISPNDQTGVPFKFKKAEQIPTEVKCDIHAWMKARWLILDHPYAAITDADGKFKIEGLPPGKYEFRVWHENAGYVNRAYKAEVKAGETTEVAPEKVPVSKVKPAG